MLEWIRSLERQLSSSLALLTMLAVFASAPAIAQSQPEAMAIPAFFGLTSNHNDWLNLLNGQAVAKIVVLDMSTLAGSGTGLSDCTQTPNTMIDCLHANGSLVIGYVDTALGCRAVNDVLGTSGNTNTAGVGDWYAGTGNGGVAYKIDGIFFDEVAPPDPINQGCFQRSNYETIFNSVHSNHAWSGLGPDMCGGKACVMANNSQYNLSWPLDSTAYNGSGHADFSVTYENPTSGYQYSQLCGGSDGQSYFGVTQNESIGFCPNTGLPGAPANCQTTMSPAGWYFSTNYGPRTAHILRQDTSQAPVPAISSVISQSQSYQAGFLYVGDMLCNLSNGAQYGRLTAYYSNLTSSLGARLTIDRTNNGGNTGSGTVTSFGNGIKCDGSASNKCDNLIAKNTTLQLTAQPNSNSNFDGFFNTDGTRLCPQGVSPCSLTLTSNKTVRASFLNNTTYQLTLSKSGSGTGNVSSSPAGIGCGTNCPSVAASFPSGTTVYLTATPDAASRFAGFSSNCTVVTSTECQITMTAAATVTATFIATQTLTVSKSGQGSGAVTSSPAGISCGSSCSSASQPFDRGTTVTLTAAPDNGSSFTSFSSNCTPVSGNPTQCTIVMSAGATVTATFGAAVPKYWLTVSKAGTGGGTVTSTPGAINCGSSCSYQYTSATIVTLAAAPDAYSSFTSFSSNCTPVSGNPTQCTITMGADSTVTVTFTATMFPLTVSKTGTGSGTVTSTPSGISCGSLCASTSSYFNSGSTVTLATASDANSTFTGFSSNCTPVSGNPSQCTIVMSAAATVTTAFAGTSPPPVVPPLFADKFARTTGLGSDWNVVNGAYTTDGSSAISGSPPINGNWAAVVPAMRTNDYAVVSDIVIPSGSLYSGIVARGSPSPFDDNLYAAQLSTDGNVYLYRRNSWNWTALATASAGITANTRYTLKLLVKGSNPVHLEVWLGGALQIELDDASANRITSGVPGIENYDANVKYLLFSVYPAPLFDDNFKRTTGLGANWTVTPGSYTTDGESAISGAPPIGGNWAQVNTSLGTNDYVVTSDVVVPAGSIYSGIVARNGDTYNNNLYAQQISTDGNVYLYRRNGGTWTTLGTAAAGIVAGTRYSLRLLVSGSNPVHLEAWVNGAIQIVIDDASSSRLSSGAPGIENYDASVRYSSFAVYAGPMFADRFTRTTGLGSAWVTDYGSYTTDGSGAVSGSPPTQGNWAHIAAPPSTADYAVEADLTIPAGSPYSGVVGRSAVSNAFTSDLYAAQISTDGSIYLYRRNAWNWTVLTSANAGIVAGVSYTVRLITVGSNPVHLEAWLNGSKLVQFDDSSTSQLSTGGVGIENYNTGVRYGTFIVYPR